MRIVIEMLHAWPYIYSVPIPTPYQFMDNWLPTHVLEG